MERDKFEALVAQALDDLPEAFRERLTNVASIVEDLPLALKIALGCTKSRYARWQSGRQAKIHVVESA
jgi:predicted Zn-dependent protease with MMP-like domain